MGTLVPNLVKVAYKDKIMKILKFVKIGLRLLLDTSLQAKSPYMATLIMVSWKKYLSM